MSRSQVSVVSKAHDPEKVLKGNQTKSYVVHLVCLPPATSDQRPCFTFRGLNGNRTARIASHEERKKQKEAAAAAAEIAAAERAKSEAAAAELARANAEKADAQKEQSAAQSGEAGPDHKRPKQQRSHVHSYERAIV